LEKNGLIDLAQVGKIVARRAFRTLKLAQKMLFDKNRKFVLA
jgi:hypothetical protein